MKDKIMNFVIVILLIAISVIITLLVLTNLNKESSTEVEGQEVEEQETESISTETEIDEEPDEESDSESDHVQEVTVGTSNEEDKPSTSDTGEDDIESNTAFDTEPEVINNGIEWDGGYGEFRPVTDNPEDEWKDGTPITPYLNTLYKDNTYGKLQQFTDLVECDVPDIEGADVIITSNEDYTGELLEYVQSPSVMAAIEEASKSWPELGKYRLFSVSQFHDNTYRLYKFIFQDGTVQDIFEYKDCSIFNWRAKESLKFYMDCGTVDNMKNVYK